MLRRSVELERTLLVVPSWQVRSITIVVCLMLNVLPWPSTLLAPDFVAAAIVAWNLALPGALGLGVSWLLGLVMDVQRGTPLGLTALTYSLLCFGAVLLQRRLIGFSLGGRLAHVLGLYAAVFFVAMLLRFVTEGRFSAIMVVSQALMATLLWLGLRLVIHRLGQRRRRQRRIQGEARQP